MGDSLFSAEKKRMEHKSLSTYLTDAVNAGASDIFFQVGSPVNAKVHGELDPVDDYRLTAEDMEAFAKEMLDKAGRSYENFEKSRDDDFAFYLPDIARFRVNIYHQRGTISAVIRVIAFRIPNYKDANIPEEIMSLADIRSGLVLVTGTTGSGKSTTLACIVDRINHTRKGHIITIEDPIEFMHKNDKCIISQREVFIDALDFDSALRAALREAPNVILLGEMRDYQTIRIAISAAETGHLVLATMHTQGAANTVDRIIDSFPSDQQPQIRMQASMALQAVVSQKLLKGKDGILHPAFEVMRTNMAVKSLIREGQTHMIGSTVSAGKNSGMIAMDDSILSLYRNGLIDKETALANANSYEAMQAKVGSGRF